MIGDWKLGEVALVECSDGEFRRAMFSTHSVDRPTKFWAFPDGLGRTPDSVARPLVVIDPEKIPHLSEFDASPREALLALASDVESADRRQTGIDLDASAAVLRWLAEQIPLPPKPDEPIGIGAVVKDLDGDLWVSSGPIVSRRRWTNTTDGFRSTWDAIRSVDIILSKGVQP